MKDGAKNKCIVLEKARAAREKYLPYTAKTLRRLVIWATVMFAWILVWSLLLKCGMEHLLIRTYSNLKGMTFEERLLWDLIPFNYRGTEYWIGLQILTTILNCFVFAPLGIAFCYLFKKQNLLRDALICLGCSMIIEILQLFTVLGNPATEDLITNTAGCIIGFGIYHLLLKRLSVKHTIWLFSASNVILIIATAISLVTTVGSFDVIIKIITRTL